jgi:hypothetical protein
VSCDRSPCLGEHFVLHDGFVRRLKQAQKVKNLCDKLLPGGSLIKKGKITVSYDDLRKLAQLCHLISFDLELDLAQGIREARKQGYVATYSRKVENFLKRINRL